MSKHAKKEEEINYLEFWDSVQETDPKHTKPISFGGRKFNTIDAYYQIKTATSHWGMYGTSWGLRNLQYNQINDTPLMRVSAEFYYPTGELSCAAFEITSAIKIANNKGVFDDDFAKKVETDLITKSLSRLGFNADVFLGMFDDNKYTQELNDKYTPQYTDTQKKLFDKFIEDEDGMQLEIMAYTVGVKAFTDLYNSFPKGQKVKMKQVVDLLQRTGAKKLDDYHDQVIEYIDSNDAHGLKETTDGLGDDGKIIIWNRLNDEQQAIAKELFATLQS